MARVQQDYPIQAILISKRLWKNKDKQLDQVK